MEGFRKESIQDLVGAKGSQSARTEQELRDDYIHVFGTAAGNRVLMDLVKNCYIFSPFGQQNASSYAKEGKRELGLYILGRLGLNEDINSLHRLIQMLQASLK